MSTIASIYRSKSSSRLRRESPGQHMYHEMHGDHSAAIGQKLNLVGTESGNTIVIDFSVVCEFKIGRIDSSITSRMAGRAKWVTSMIIPSRFISTTTCRSKSVKPCPEESNSTALIWLLKAHVSITCRSPSS